MITLNKEYNFHYKNYRRSSNDIHINILLMDQNNVLIVIKSASTLILFLIIIFTANIPYKYKTFRERKVWWLNLLVCRSNCISFFWRFIFICCIITFIARIIREIQSNISRKRIISLTIFSYNFKFCTHFIYWKNFN